MTVSVALYTPGFFRDPLESGIRATHYALRDTYIPFRQTDRQSGDTSVCLFLFFFGPSGRLGSLPSMLDARGRARSALAT